MCVPTLAPLLRYGNISTTSNDQFEALAAAEGVTSGEAYALASIVSTLSKAVSDFLSAPVQIMAGLCTSWSPIDPNGFEWRHPLKRLKKILKNSEWDTVSDLPL